MTLVLTLLLLFIPFVYLYLLNTRYQIRDEQLHLYFGISKVSISILEINEIEKAIHDEDNKDAQMVGFPFAHKDRLLIRTRNQSYFLALNDANHFIDKLLQANPSILIKSN